MKKMYLFLFSWLWMLPAIAQNIASPGGKLVLSFALTGEGEPTYQLSLGRKTVVKPSKLGLALKDQPGFLKGFTVANVDSSSKNETWEPVWGEVKTIQNRYREQAFTLQQASADNRKLIIRFRLYDDGVGFRYEFPEQNGLKYFVVADEHTEFNLTGDHKTFWIPGDYDSNEYAYTTSKLSEIDALKVIGEQKVEVQSPVKDGVQTPLMLKTDDGLYINIHEAALVNYPVMHLVVDKQQHRLTSHLASDGIGNKAYLQTPCTTPWRTIIASEKAADILASKLVLNLNEPAAIGETSWIKPVKYVGIWWEMHMNKSTWNYANVNNVRLGQTDWASLKPNGTHGATNANTKRYIDFAANNGFDAVLVEGWNVGWEDWIGNWKEEVFDFVTPYPDFDVPGLKQYAQEKGVKLIMHHETSGSVTNYERRMDTAYCFMNKNGYNAVKTGYVGRIIPRGEHHDSQWMVNHFVRVAQKTAHYHLMLDSHESVRPTGLHRTYPNWMASEAARGNEFNAWSSGNPPEHETILPFTRLVGGPMDYTPGIFQIKLDFFQPGRQNQVQTTLAKQLALYVTIYSPLQMAADLPESYERFMDAFQFIKDVAVDWDDTKILEAEPGDYVTIARKAKNKDEWYIGAITDEQARSSQISLNFLEPGRWYVATLYADATNAHWKNNPIAYQIRKVLVNSWSVLKLHLASGGGCAISLKPASEKHRRTLKKQ